MSNKKSISVALVTESIASTRREKNFQIAVERMQLDVAKGAVEVGDKAFIQLEKELNRVANVRQGLAERKLLPVSNFDALALMLNEHQATTRESIVAEAMSKAEAKKAVPFGGATKEQAATIDGWYALWAMKKWNTLGNARAVYAFVRGDVKKAQEIAQSLRVMATKKVAAEPVTN
jgi:hypothetical protein